MQSNRFQKFIDRYIGILIVLLLSFINFLITFLNKIVKPSELDAVDSPKKILLIQLSALGDTILAIPTLRSLRENFPHVEISILTSSTNLSYLAQCPYIDHCIQFSHLMVGGNSDSRLLSIHQLLQALRKEGFDWVIDLEHWSRFSVILAYVTGASRRIGFQAARQYRHYLFTDILPHIPGKHEVLNFLSIAHHLGCLVTGTHLEVWIGASEREWCQNLLVTEKVDLSAAVVVLHPEAGRRGEPRRRWAQDRYVMLADMLATRYGAQIVLTGAPDEVAVVQYIAEQAKTDVICLAGKTQINQLAALFRHANLVICGNCGPMHLAAAAGTPVIAIHGPTNSRQWGPWSEKATYLEASLPCSPCLNLGFEYACQALPDGTSPCMQTIEVSDVLQACEIYLDKYQMEPEG